MTLLLDTHTFLWFSAGSTELSSKARELIIDKNNLVYLSIASLWEISIKTALGKLSIAGSYELVMDDVTNNGIEILPVNFAHTIMQNQLPFHHRDPFDRMLVSQSLVEGFDLLSRDEILDPYFLGKFTKRIW